MNLFAMLFAAINIAEPAIEEDDTQEFVPLTLHTRPIDPDELHELTQLENTLAAYQLGGYGEWILGHITLAAEQKPGRIMVHFEPVPRTDMSLMSKWRSIEDVRYAWYAPEGQ